MRLAGDQQHAQPVLHAGNVGRGEVVGERQFVRDAVDRQHDEVVAAALQGQRMHLRLADRDVSAARCGSPLMRDADIDGFGGRDR